MGVCERVRYVYYITIAAGRPRMWQIVCIYFVFMWYKLCMIFNQKKHPRPYKCRIIIVMIALYCTTCYTRYLIFIFRAIRGASSLTYTNDCLYACILACICINAFRNSPERITFTFSSVSNLKLCVR